MATEAQRQRQLIDSGFLDNVGANEPDIELNEVEKIFVQYMGQLLEAMQRRVNTPGSDGREITASGELSESMRFEYTVDGFAYEALFYMADYADYRDKGVQGVGPNNTNTTSPYRFKSAFPSKQMQKALLLWVREKANLEDKTAPKGLKGKYTRNYLRNKDRRNQLVIGIGIGIKRHGIKPGNFKEASIEEIMADMLAALGKALAKDIKVSIDTSVLK